MDFQKQFQEIITRLRKEYQRMNALSGGVLGVIRSTVERFTEERGSEAAAGMAYYAFFSIFPMLLVFIVVGSFFVDVAVLQAQLLNMLEGVLPGAEDVVIQNIDQVLRLRGTVTVFALIFLIWAATGVFNNLVRNINRAFPQAELPDFVRGRLMGFLVMLGLGFLFLLSFAASVVSEFLPVIDVSINDISLHEWFIWPLASYVVPVIINILMFWALYQWVPTVNVITRASFIGGVAAGVAWEFLKRGFTWYLSGFTEYQLVYGSLGTIVALLFWIYLTATIVLIGAHLTAAIQKAIRQKSAARDV